MIGNYIKAVATGAPIDTDAQAFITAAAITNSTQITAINNLVIDLKKFSVWTKLKAIYPFVGGTATTHKFNLKNPADTDAAFRLVFSGGWTHNSNGVTPNGTNAWADTFYNLSVQSTSTNISSGVYSRTNAISNGISYGADNSGFVGNALIIKATDNLTYWSVNDVITNFASNIVSDTRGFFVTSRLTTNTANKIIYRNGLELASTLQSFQNVPNFKIAIGARNNNGVIGNYDNKNYAFMFFGDNLSIGEIYSLSVIVQSYQTTLSRNV